MTMTRGWVHRCCLLAAPVFSCLVSACAMLPEAGTASRVPDYSAVQVIETTPGPFVNRIHVTHDRERQDASLGGGVVTTIIRRDKGVAWLLIPAKRQYEEIPLAAGTVPSVHTGVQGAAVTRRWVSAEGIVLRTEIAAATDAGTPGAVIRLEDLRIEPQDPALFELPAGYTKSGPP